MTSLVCSVKVAALSRQALLVELGWSTMSIDWLLMFLHHIYQHIYIHIQYFPKQCGHTQEVLTVTVKARCLNPGGLRSVRHFSCKFQHKMALVKCPCAFRLRRLAQNACRGIGVRHCLGKFPHKMALLILKCPCAFRLRRLAQNVCRGIGVRHFSCTFPRKIKLLF